MEINTDPLSLAGVATGAITLGGACFIATAVAPVQVMAGVTTAGTCLALGQAKKQTGSYLPFLGKSNDNKQAEAAPAAA